MEIVLVVVDMKDLAEQISIAEVMFQVQHPMLEH